MIKSLFLILLVAALVAGSALAVRAFWIEPRSLVVTRADIDVAPWPAEEPLTIAVLADIQAAGPHLTAERVAEIVAQVNALEPDLIVLLGDYVSQMRFSTSHVPPKATAAVLAKLRAPLGVHAVLGNHDWWLDGRYIRRLLEESGIRVYENDALLLDAGDGRRLWIAGLADLSTRSVDLPGTLAQVTDDAPVILLSHSPDIFPEVPERVALTLAGHTHGGQVNLPYVGRLLVPSRFGQRYAYGHIIENGRQMFVSSGLGNAILPVRFGVPPEIVLLRLGAPRAGGDRADERSELYPIEPAVGTHARAQIDPERPDLANRSPDIVGAQAAR
jgi:predicted MPP superfamily phosphohydrolase